MELEDKETIKFHHSEIERSIQRIQTQCNESQELCKKLIENLLPI